MLLTSTYTIMTDKKSKHKKVLLTDKCTEMFGNIQLGEYYTQDIHQIRVDFANVLCDIPYIDSYMFIVHDDSDYLHIHFCFLLKVQVRLSTMINKLSDLFNVNPQAISIDKLISIVGTLKYFLHLTDDSIEDGKKIYDESELWSNESPTIIKGYLESESSDNVSITLIRQLVIECDLKSDVLIRLRSDKLIRKNRYYIDTMWNDKPMLQLRQDRYDDELPF